MSFWFLLQILINVVLFAVVAVVWVKLSRPQKDDPRMSKGLQLLQSKIAVLEDLSDRTEIQVNQLTAILENKCKELQEKIIFADKQIANIDHSMQKSLEVAKIFQDKIPHEEIIERQSTIKYVKAAKLANQGMSADDIAKEVDLSRGEIEFIAKVNREQLMFSEENLPEWAQQEPERKTTDTIAKLSQKFQETHKRPESFAMPSEKGISLPKSSSQNFVELLPTEDSRSEVTVAASPAAASTVVPVATPVITPAQTIALPFVQNTTSASPAPQPLPAERVLTSSGKAAIVRPVLFPRIDLDKDLL